MSNNKNTTSDKPTVNPTRGFEFNTYINRDLCCWIISGCFVCLSLRQDFSQLLFDFITVLIQKSLIRLMKTTRAPGVHNSKSDMFEVFIDFYTALFLYQTLWCPNSVFFYFINTFGTKNHYNSKDSNSLHTFLIWHFRNFLILDCLERGWALSLFNDYITEAGQTPDKCQVSVIQCTQYAFFSALEHQIHNVCGSIDIAVMSEHSWDVHSVIFILMWDL